MFCSQPGLDRALIQLHLISHISCLLSSRYARYQCCSNIEYLTISSSLHASPHKQSIKMHTNTLWLALALLRASVVTANPFVRALSCPRNNEYNCFLASPTVATPWCSSYISIPLRTITVTTSFPGTTTYLPPSPSSSSQNSDSGNHSPSPTIRATIPGCIPSSSVTSPYEKSVLSNACSCLSIPMATTTVVV